MCIPSTIVKFAPQFSRSLGDEFGGAIRGDIGEAARKGRSSCFQNGGFETVQDKFITPLYQQHASHTLASRAHGPQPHMRSYSATGPYIFTALSVTSGLDSPHRATP